MSAFLDHFILPQKTQDEDGVREIRSLSDSQEGTNKNTEEGEEQKVFPSQLTARQRVCVELCLTLTLEKKTITESHDRSISVKQVSDELYKKGEMIPLSCVCVCVSMFSEIKKKEAKREQKGQM